jgi:hypothetical protein
VIIIVVETVEDAPGKGALGASALQREVDRETTSEARQAKAPKQSEGCE